MRKPAFQGLSRVFKGFQELIFAPGILYFRPVILRSTALQHSSFSVFQSRLPPSSASATGSDTLGAARIASPRNCRKPRIAPDSLRPAPNLPKPARAHPRLSAQKSMFSNSIAKHRTTVRGSLRKLTVTPALCARTRPRSALISAIVRAKRGQERFQTCGHAQSES